MKASFVHRLACPDCGGGLKLLNAVPLEGGLRDGRLLCQGCPARFEIRDGIPRFVGPTVDRRSRRSFGYQWRAYREGDRTWFKDDAAQRRVEFLAGIDLPADQLAGKALLDAGCGNGELTRAIAGYGLQVVGIDFSTSVEDASRRLPASLVERVQYVQADVNRPPFPAASFDLVHSSGVLHHTASTAAALRALAPLVRPGGRLYVQVYRRRGWPIHFLNAGLRSITRRLPLPLLYGLCYVASPLHATLSRWTHRLRGEPPPPRASARERAVQMFDNYSPRYQHRHTVDEIAALLRTLGFERVREVTLDNERRHMLALLGERPG